MGEEMFSVGQLVRTTEAISVRDVPVGTIGRIEEVNPEAGIIVVEWTSFPNDYSFHRSMLPAQLEVMSEIQVDMGYSYKQTKEKEEGSVKFGDLWITPAEGE